MTIFARNMIGLLNSSVQRFTQLSCCLNENNDTQIAYKASRSPAGGSIGKHTVKCSRKGKRQQSALKQLVGKRRPTVRPPAECARDVRRPTVCGRDVRRPAVHGKTSDGRRCAAETSDGLQCAADTPEGRRCAADTSGGRDRAAETLVF